jgi:hypothetical protein
LDQVQEREQDHRPDEGDYHAPHEPEGAAREEDPKQEAANQSADDADDDVADDAEPGASDHHPSKPASDQTDQKPENNAHEIHVFLLEDRSSSETILGPLTSLALSRRGG